ncbi:TPA: L-asparaginase, partial [Mannheimia haemolytica]|nr:L-asparaginase [Mannheimia haemolytica]
MKFKKLALAAMLGGLFVTANAAELPNITILATGGTIAG